ncbi:long-chain fatty acid--CoA ligase [Rhodoligotrophos defluvii]|uniref:long-chain fatty acid--CoA ligase n=1 Tax=Rhodoligotrophos defluvii TaxID=2561934 RepID=UPI0010C9B533|nr:long-chain fatty acid--CoA ligase [Rhodoligotrophos defluvii]
MTTLHPDLSNLDTLPKLLAHNAAAFPEDVALREKKLGIWRPITWREYQARVRSIGLGFLALGISRGDVVAIVGDNRPDWVCSEIAAHAIGAVSIGIYRDALDEEMAYLIDHAGAVAVVAEDEEQVDKLLNLGERLPRLTHIIYCDPRGMRKYSDPRLMFMSDLVRVGDAYGAAQPSAYETHVAAGRGEDVAILCTTSGTTSQPKLAVLQSRALLAHAAVYLEVDPRAPGEDYVSVLPLPWIMEQIYALGWGLVARMVVNFVEEPETSMHDFREIAPHFVLFAPRIWEQIAADIRARIMDTSPEKRAIYEAGLRLGLAARAQGGRSQLADILLFRALRDRLGFSRLKSAATGGAALGPETFRFFQAMGVPLRQLYGQTEMLGAYCIHPPQAVDLDTVGVPFPGVEVKIVNPDQHGVGEIIARHAHMFASYFRNEGATREAVRGGWMHTGDAGYFDDKGHLIVIDRLQDMAETAGGHRFSPQYIENKLKFSPYIAEAVIVGAGRDYLAAMLCIRGSIVSKWAEKGRISFTTYADLSAKPEVYDLLRREVEEVNRSLPAHQQIRKFLLLYKELDADDGELTRTRKVRRGVIADKYGSIIEAIYRGEPAIDVDTTIALQDGTRQRVRTRLRIVDLHPQAAEPAAVYPLKPARERYRA